MSIAASDCAALATDACAVAVTAETGKGVKNTRVFAVHNRKGVALLDFLAIAQSNIGGYETVLGHDGFASCVFVEHRIVDGESGAGGIVDAWVGVSGRGKGIVCSVG